MKTAGVVFDFYDDATGALLKRAFPDADSLPDVVKTAHILNEEEREVLRDEAYALIMVNNGKTLRKFACVDAGNTLLSAMYFVENRELFPEEAQKIASANIIAACEQFGLELDPMLKEAAATPKRRRDPMDTPVLGDEADWNQRTNLTSIQGGQDSGKVMGASSVMKTAGFINVYVVKGPDGQAIAVPKNKVDVSSHSPAPKVEKKASLTALNGEYPLDSYTDVLKAVSYFEDNYRMMDPADAHEYAVKTAARADELGIAVSDMLERYGSTEYAPDTEAHLAHRQALSSDEFKPVYEELREKRASIDPEVFAKLLVETDDASGLKYLYGQIADPYYVTFGGDSEREKVASWNWSAADGTSVNAEQLSGVSSRLGEHFDSSVVSAFEQDPIAIFESMPEPQKIIIARLAQE